MPEISLPGHPSPPPYAFLFPHDRTKLRVYRYELPWEIAFLLAKDDWEYGFSPLYRWGAEKGRRGGREDDVAQVWG